MNDHHRMALRVAVQIERAQARRAGPNRESVIWPDAEWTSCRRLSRRLKVARQRGWQTAASRLQQRLQRELHTLRLQLDRVTLPADTHDLREHPLPLRTLYEEVLALYDEFEQVECDLIRRTLSVISEPIELECIDLGRFEIRLKYAALSDSTRYEVIALDPNPAASNSSVTHPHVQSERLCEGDGQSAIRSALAQGRLCDFFQIVVQILQTYNDSSPYVSLDDWNGDPCEDCGSTTSEHDRAFCGYCERLLCDQCQTCCSVCCEGCCDGCTDRCDGCEELTCRNCRQNCSTCESVFCDNCLDDGTCETCHAAEAAKEDADETTAVAAKLAPAAGEADEGAAGTAAAVHAVCVGEAAVPARSG